jgi:nucleoside-diphosphate-sugar epimerase
MNTILITGATGQIGKKLSEYLSEIGHQIIPVALVQRDGVISADLRDEATVFLLVNALARG